MSFNLIAESKGHLNWSDISGRLHSVLSAVEVFPIPGEGGSEKDALGISIPRREATPQVWDEVARIVRLCQREFGLHVIELYSSEEISDSNLDRLREMLLGDSG